MAELAIAPEPSAGVAAAPPQAPGVSIAPRPPGAGPVLNPDEAQQLAHSTQNQPISDAITVAAQSAPNLDPSTVVGIAGTGGDIQQKAEAIGAALKMHNMIDSATEVNAAKGGANVVDDALSWFGHNVVKPLGTALHYVGETPIGKGLSDLQNALNLPLNDIQHEYRYLHDVEARHGLTAAIAEGLAITAGVVGGTVLGGPDGAILGGEGVAQVLGGIMYRDSWARTANGKNYTDPNTGNVVSFGRDLASVFTHEMPKYVPGSHQKVLSRQGGVFGTLSGVLDGVGDMITDPLALAGKLKAGVSGVEGGAGVIGKHWGGLGITDPTLIDKAYTTNPSFRRAVGMIAEHDDTSWVAGHFPKMIPIARYLAGAQTDQQVLDVLKAPVLTANLMTDHLPTMSFARQGWQGVRDWAEGTSDTNRFLGNNFVYGPARWSRRFSKVSGSAFDEQNKTFSGKVLDPFSDQHAQDIHQFVSYTQSGRVADMAAEQWLEAAPAQRIILIRNLIMDNVAHAAHFAPTTDENGVLDYAEMTDPGVRSAMKAKLDEWTGGGDPGQTGVFGMHNDGSPSARVRDDETGRAWAAAVLRNQTGKIGLPSFTNIKRMGAELRQLRGAGFAGSALDDIGYYSGKLDDFAYDAVTARFFKPLVLLSGSYAWHISLAEAIPNTLRLGLRNMVRSYYHQFSSGLGYETEGRDVDAILGSIARMAGTDRPNYSRLRWEAEVLSEITTESHKVPMAVSSAESWSKEYSDGSRFKKALHDLVSGQPGHTTDRFGVFEPHDHIEGYKKGDSTGFMLHWRDAIREANSSPESLMALKAYWAGARRGLSESDALYDAGRVAASELKKLPPDELAMFQRGHLYSETWNRNVMTPPPGWTPVDDWGQEIAHNMRSLLGRTQPNPDLVQHMLHQTTPTVDRLRQLFTQDEWPAAVKGRIQAPSTPGTVGAITDYGFKHAINPFVNFVSRQPLWRIEFYNQWKQLRPLVENGIYDLDEARNIAANRAVFKSVAFVHNLHDRSQISETLRNWLPFYFAQEQAYRRMGRFLAEDPGGFRRYQMMISGAATMTGSAVDGTNGQKYYLVPGGAFLSKGAAEIFSRLHLPLVNVATGQLQTSLSSAGVILPLSSSFRPDLSPVAALSAKALYGTFPELGPSLSKIMTTQNLTDPLWKFLVPNTAAQRLLEALPTPGLGQTSDRAFVSAMNSAIEMAAYEQTQAQYKWIVGGQKGPAPQIVPPDAIAGVNAQGGFQATKAQQDFLNRIKNQTMILFLTNMMVSEFLPVSTTPGIKDFGFTNEVNNDITKAGSVSKGVQTFLAAHPLATPYTVFKSYSNSGASIQATAPAENWINSHQGFINKYPNIAYYMMPNVKGAPFDYGVYNEQLAQGTRVRRSPQEFLNALYVEAGNVAYYPELEAYEKAANAPGASSSARSAAYNAFQSWLLPFQAAHPIWAALGPLNTAAKQATLRSALTQLGQMSQDHDAPNTPEAGQVMELYGAYQQFNREYFNDQASHRYATLTRDLKQSWRGYLDAVAAKHPELQGVVSSIFMDALGSTTQGVSTSGG